MLTTLCVVYVDLLCTLNQAYCMTFWSFMMFNCDDCMKTVFILLHKTISNLLCQFYDYVLGNA